MSFLCRLCGSSHVDTLIDFGNHPIAHHFLHSPVDREATYHVRLACCPDCNLIQLQDTIPAEELYTNYVTLSCWKSQPHMRRVTSIVAECARSRDVPILELGCNDGGFLEALASACFQNLLGIEPANDAYMAAENKNLPVMQAYFNPQIAKRLVSQRGQFDIIVARQVLEHIADLRAFAEAIRIALSDNGYLIIEVPDFDFCLEARDYSAVWEEHANYFTTTTLARFFRLAGCELMKQESVVFSGMAKIACGQRRLETNGRSCDSQIIGNHHHLVSRFRDDWPVFRANLHSVLQLCRANGERVAVYGAGCRACSLVNYTGIGDLIDFFIDDQPEKQNRYMPGSRKLILPSSVLLEKRISMCLLAVNGENEAKVLARNQALINGGVSFASILPPSEHLIPVWPGSGQGGYS